MAGEDYTVALSYDESGDVWSAELTTNPVRPDAAHAQANGVTSEDALIALCNSLGLAVEQARAQD